MGEPIFVINGEKGGPGKSLVARTAVDFIFREFPSKEILIVETDVSGADVGQCYDLGLRQDDKAFCERYARIMVKNLNMKAIKRGEDSTDEGTLGWRTFSDTLEKNQDRVIVVNCGAALIDSAVANAGTFCAHLKEHGLNYITLWVMNTVDTSVASLKAYMEAFDTVTHAVKNLWFGDPADFVLFDKAKWVNETLKKRSGQVLHFPVLARDITRALEFSRDPFDIFCSGLPSSARVLAESWRNRVGKELEKVVGKAIGGTRDGRD
jgi:hypothetical protein